MACIDREYDLQRLGALMLFLRCLWRSQMEPPETLDDLKPDRIRQLFGRDARTLRPFYDAAMVSTLRDLMKQRVEMQPEIRAHALEVSNGVCIYCGERVDPDAFDVAHRRAVTRGGLTNRENIAAAHPLCNRRGGTADA
jgi:5-methylcytosine-specific restriction endonuclease McrA